MSKIKIAIITAAVIATAGGLIYARFKGLRKQSMTIVTAMEAMAKTVKEFIAEHKADITSIESSVFEQFITNTSEVSAGLNSSKVSTLAEPMCAALSLLTMQTMMDEIKDRIANNKAI